MTSKEKKPKKQINKKLITQHPQKVKEVFKKKLGK